MTTAWRDPSPKALDVHEHVRLAERSAPPRRVESRQEFHRWLKTVVRDLGDRPADDSNERQLSRILLRIWEFAVECANRFCPECRNELEETVRITVQSACGGEDSGSSEEVLARLRALYSLTASPVEKDADRLAKYILNFSSRGHKAMLTELWTKGYASYHRLANLRGKNGVTANADRNAIDRLVAKAELLWTKERQIRIQKEPAGLSLVKQDPRAVGIERFPDGDSNSS